MHKRFCTRKHRTFVVVASGFALVLSLLGVTAAVSAPASDGWHEGACKRGEGLTVVVDFGVGSERDPEARCRVGGRYGDPALASVLTLESVGYDVTTSGGLVVRIGGVGNDHGVPDWWMYTAVEGEGAWSTSSGWTVPEQATDWFQGVCFSQQGCQPRLPAQFAEGTLDPDPTDPDPTDPDPTDPPVVKVTSKPQLTWARKPTAGKTGKAGRLRVRVPRVAGRAKPTGTIVVKIKRADKKNRSVTTRLPAGKARTVVRLPKLSRGTWKLVVIHHGDASYERARTVKNIKVKK